MEKARERGDAWSLESLQLLNLGRGVCGVAPRAENPRSHRGRPVSSRALRRRRGRLALLPLVPQLGVAAWCRSSARSGAVARLSAARPPAAHGLLAAPQALPPPPCPRMHEWRPQWTRAPRGRRRQRPAPPSATRRRRRQSPPSTHGRGARQAGPKPKRWGAGPGLQGLQERADGEGPRARRGRSGRRGAVAGASNRGRGGGGGNWRRQAVTTIATHRPLTSCNTHASAAAFPPCSQWLPAGRRAPDGVARSKNGAADPWLAAACSDRDC
jgi:hypothetical protein